MNRNGKSTLFNSSAYTDCYLFLQPKQTKIVYRVFNQPVMLMRSVFTGFTLSSVC